MKITLKYIAVLLLFSVAFIGCEDDDKNPLNLLELDDSKSPFVRIVLDQTVVPRGDLGSAALSGVVDDPSDNVAFRRTVAAIFHPTILDEGTLPGTPRYKLVYLHSTSSHYIPHKPNS